MFRAIEVGRDYHIRLFCRSPLVHSLISEAETTSNCMIDFPSFQQGEVDQAEKMAEEACAADTYNSAAYVNLGNCAMVREDYVKGKELFAHALENDATCIEALYNLGKLNYSTLKFCITWVS